ncbi:MAG: dTDP-4-dehydrorhamnose 3,5-epimerase [Planctomycetota bacterium]|jgi:dTDP-4-dehydrorhamnose 3,5-epimerase
MRFVPTEIDGAYIITLEPVIDERGFFARTFCEKEFKEKGLASNFVQCSIAWSKARGTLRGMHYQIAPYAEVKLVRCTRGAVYDVVIDLRPGSPSYCQWIAVELAPKDNRMLYVPKGFAHGYQTLKPDTEVSYWMSVFYMPSAQRCVRWNDPAFDIHWPISKPILSERDRLCSDFQR